MSVSSIDQSLTSSLMFELAFAPLKSQLKSRSSVAPTASVAQAVRIRSRRSIAEAVDRGVGIGERWIVGVTPTGRLRHETSGWISAALSRRRRTRQRDDCTDK